MEIVFDLSFLLYLGRAKLKNFLRKRDVRPKFEESLFLFTFRVVLAVFGVKTFPQIFWVIGIVASLLSLALSFLQPGLALIVYCMYT